MPSHKNATQRQGALLGTSDQSLVLNGEPCGFGLWWADGVLCRASTTFWQHMTLLQLASYHTVCAPDLRWDTRPTESRTRAALRDLAVASLALLPWVFFRLLRCAPVGVAYTVAYSYS